MLFKRNFFKKKQNDTSPSVPLRLRRNELTSSEKNQNDRPTSNIMNQTDEGSSSQEISSSTSPNIEDASANQENMNTDSAYDDEIRRQWDTYYKELEAYEKAKAEIEKQQTAKAEPASTYDDEIRKQWEKYYKELELYEKAKAEIEKQQKSKTEAAKEIPQKSQTPDIDACVEKTVPTIENISKNTTGTKPAPTNGDEVKKQDDRGYAQLSAHETPQNELKENTQTTIKMPTPILSPQKELKKVEIQSVIVSKRSPLCAKQIPKVKLKN